MVARGATGRGLSPDSTGAFYRAGKAARTVSVGLGTRAEVAVVRARCVGREVRKEVLKLVAGSYVGPKSGGAVGPILLQSHVVS